MTTNRKEIVMKKIKLIIIIIAAITVVLVSGALLASVLSNRVETVKLVPGEHWTADFSDPYTLKKIVVDKQGKLSSIHYYQIFMNEIPGEVRREIFYYKGGKLTYSITYDYDNVTATLGEAKYETRYVYNNDRFVGAEVFTPLGTKTLSYDEYEYAENGEIKAVRRYEYEELAITYHFDGEKFPQYVDFGGLTYTLSYDENKNLTEASEKNGIAEANKYAITYQNGSPSSFSFDHYVYDFDHGYVVKPYDTELRFDERGLLTKWGVKKITYNEKDAIVSVNMVVDGLTKETIEFTYDKQGRLSERVQTHCYYRDGETEPYKTSVDSKRVHGYDKNGNMRGYTKTVNGKSTIYLFVYDEGGNLIKETADSVHDDYYDEKEYTYEFYPSGRLKKRTYLSKKESLCGYEYDENGNVTVEYSYGTVFEYLSLDVAYPFSRIESPRREPKYKRAIFKKSQIDWEYDENYNCIRTVTTYDTGKKLVQEYYENGQRKSEIEYDSNGNITSETYYSEDGKHLP